MERGDFFRQVRDGVANAIEDESVPLARIQEAAKKALEAGGGEEEDVEIPEDRLEWLQSEYPEVLGAQDKPTDEPAASRADLEPER